MTQCLFEVPEFLLPKQSASFVVGLLDFTAQNSRGFNIHGESPLVFMCQEHFTKQDLVFFSKQESMWCNKISGADYLRPFSQTTKLNIED
jgi:hypothetical protein